MNETIKTSQQLIHTPTNNLLKRHIVSAVLVALFSISASSAVQAQVKSGRATETSDLGIYEVNTEIGDALKEALLQGVSVGTARLSARNGFLRNEIIKISFPSDAKKVERTLRRVGAGILVENAVISMNRAAEAAVAEARPIFVNAIQQLEIADGTEILFGKNDAATSFLKRGANAEIIESLKPIIAAKLNDSDAIKYWNDVNSTYNSVVKKSVTADLVAYLTQKVMDGIYFEIAREETNIRKNPKARTSPLLQRAFIFSDKQFAR